MVTRMVEPVEKVKWDEFTRKYFNAKKFLPGEHVTLIGPNGRGKTFLAFNAILPIRANSLSAPPKMAVGPLARRSKDLELPEIVVVVDVKTDDETLNEHTEYKVIKAWPPHRISAENHLFRLAPPAREIKDLPKQKKVVADFLDRLFTEGHCTAYFDEIRVVSDGRYMGLGGRMEAIWQTGRSRKTTIIASTQQPKYVPHAMYSQARHIFIWKNQDIDAVKRLAEIGGNTKRIQEAVQHLAFHDFLYVDVGKDRLVVSRYQPEGQ